MFFVILVFQLAGWQVNFEKSHLEPAQTMQYLGFVIDTVNMKFFLPQRRLVDVKTKLDHVLYLCKSKLKVHVKVLAEVLGSLASMSKSHGSILMVMTRHSQHILGKTVFENDWNSFCLLDEHAATELSFLSENLEKLNGTNIFNTKTPVKIFDSEYLVETSVDSSESYNSIVSDASASKSFLFSADKKFTLVSEFVFTETEIKLSSGHRELLALVKAIEENEHWFLENKGLIYWLTDSQNAFNFLNRGSRKLYIQQDVLKVKLLEKRLGLKISPIWVPRTDSNIVLADIGSKLDKSSDEWSIDSNSFDAILNFFEISVTLDGFATNENRKCQKFFSKIPQSFCDGIHFFAQILVSSEIYWLCPPPALVSNVIDHFLSFNEVTGVLICPVWKGSDYFVKLVENLRFAPFVANYYLFSPRFTKIIMLKLFLKV